MATPASKYIASGVGNEMKTNDLVSQVRLSPLYNEQGNAPLKRELLAFWNRHPNGKFPVSTISCALDYRKIKVKKALEELVKTGLIDAYIESGLTLYSLTKDENKRELVLQSLASDRNRQRLPARSLE